MSNDNNVGGDKKVFEGKVNYDCELTQTSSQVEVGVCVSVSGKVRSGFVCMRTKGEKVQTDGKERERKSLKAGPRPPFYTRSETSPG